MADNLTKETNRYFIALNKFLSACGKKRYREADIDKIAVLIGMKKSIEKYKGSNGAYAHITEFIKNSADITEVYKEAAKMADVSTRAKFFRSLIASTEVNN